MSDDWNAADPDSPRVLYDLGMWSFDQQAELAAELAEAEIPHSWDGAELVVPEAFEAAADSTISLVEERLGIVYNPDAGEPHDDPAAAPIDITSGAPTTEYDLEEWSEAGREAVGRALTRQGHPFRWDGDLLLVHTDDEDVVEALLDMVENGEFGLQAFADDEGAERLPFETLTTFFLAGDRLRRDPLDADGLEQLLDAVELADPDRPPYGVDIRLWHRTCELADELTGALVDDDELDHETAMAAADELHGLLRPYI